MFSTQLVHRILDASPVARLAQIDEHGGPQALPFVFFRSGNALWSPIDGKPKKNARLDRIEWIRKRPDVLVLIDHYDGDWSRLWWVKLFGEADVVGESVTGWELAVEGLGQKYPQYNEIPMFTGVPTMIRIDISRWKSWSAAGDAAIAGQFGL